MLRKCDSLVAVLVCLLLLSSAKAQTFLVPAVKFIDKSTGKAQDWSVSGSATENQGFVFPGSMGTAGQVLKVSSVSSGSATLGWSTPGASAAETSGRLTSDATESAAWDTGPTINVVGNKNYRIVGEFFISRGATGGNDDFKLRLNVTSTTDTVQFAIDCYDCPSGTTGVPQSRWGVASGTPASVTMSTDINPGGSSGANADQEGNIFHYRIEGLLKVKATGTVRLTFNKSGASEDTVMKKDSYWTLIEVE